MKKILTTLFVVIYTFSIVKSQEIIFDVYELTIDSTHRINKATFKKIPKYLRIDYWEDDGYIIPGQQTTTFFFSNNQKECFTPPSMFDMSGYVKTEREFWTHPPRTGYEYLKMLELNPFPYIKTRLEQWKWNLDVGEHWGDEKWIKWSGRIIIEYDYYITNKDCFLKINNKEIPCIEVYSTAKSNITNTKSYFYFKDKRLYKSINYLVNGDILTLTKINI